MPESIKTPPIVKIGFLNKIIDAISKGHIRSIKAKQNIIFSFFLKGLSIIIGFLFVSVTIKYVSPVKYGIWLTLSSFIGWFSFFDIGLGNGLRNKFAEAVAKNKKKLARIYVSTAYASLTLLMLILLLVSYLLVPLINWVKVFNTPLELSYELRILMFIVFGSFCIKFILQLICTILVADQRPALSNALTLAGNLLSLMLIYTLTKTTQSSLLYLGTAISIMPIVVLVVSSFILFKSIYKSYSPSFKYVRFHFVKDLLNLGFKFFIISIASIVIFSSTNMLISQLYGPAEVTPYNIAYKYFSTSTMLFSIIMTPFWSAFTDAFYKRDFAWIRKVMNTLMKLWGVITLVLFLMLILSQYFYELWIGSIVQIPFNLSFAISFYFILSTFSLIFTSFLNGIGKIRLSLYSAVVEMILFIPLSVVFSKYLNFGIVGIVMASALSPLIGNIWMPVQYYKIINNKATGIWNK